MGLSIAISAYTNAAPLGVENGGTPAAIDMPRLRG